MGDAGLAEAYRVFKPFSIADHADSTEPTALPRDHAQFNDHGSLHGVLGRLDQERSGPWGGGWKRNWVADPTAESSSTAPD